MQLIKDLRAQTAAPISDCKKALEASEGDMDAAFQWLRERGSAKASDLGKREANEGLVAVVATDRCGAMVQVGCETDFSQRNADFQAFVGAVGRAAFDRVPPPPGLPGLPADVSVDALLRLDYTGDQSVGTVGDAVSDIVGKIRENISVKRACKVGDVGDGSGVCLVGHYVHGALPGFPHVGTSAALVTLSTGACAESSPLSPDALEGLKPVARKLAMHVVAAKPKYLDAGAVPPEVVESERSILAEQVADTGKPAHIVAKIVEGRLAKFYGEMTLLAQPHMIEGAERGDGKPLTVGQVVAEAGKALGLPKLAVEGFVLYRTGA